MLGGLLVIGLFVGLLYRAATAALHADRFGALLATGVVCWLGAQGFENLGMNLGLLPVTGVPLPLVSYGDRGHRRMDRCRPGAEGVTAVTQFTGPVRALSWPG